MKPAAKSRARKRPGPGTARAQPAAATGPRCERISDCLLDAMRAGAAPAVELRGQSWAIIAGGKVYGRRKDRERAEALVKAARRELGNRNACPAPPLEERRRNVLITPQRPDGEIVRYAAIPGKELLTSHQPSDFQPSRDYPESVQERAYHLDRGERQKVIRGGQKLRLALVLSRDPTATNGPPIVTERGPRGHLTMGGNGRGMMILRAYDGEGGEEYRRELIARAGEFGLEAKDVEAIQRPVLVRVLEGLTADAPRELLVAAVRRTNESLTQGLDATTLGVAHARVLSEGTVRQIGEALGDGDYSLRELMAARPDLFREALQRDQVITPQNASEWLTAAGSLSDTAKDRLEAMFLGLVLATKDRIQASAPSLLRKLERAVPALLVVRGAVPAFDLIPLLQEAADLLNDARAHDLTLEDSLRQPSLLNAGAAVPERSTRAVALARLLDTSTQRNLAEAFRRWAKVAIHDPRQATMFYEPPTPEGAFAVLLGTPDQRRPNPGRAPDVKCERCQGTGLVVPWAKKINVCPTCGGSGVVGAPAPSDARQRRLINPKTRRRRRQTFAVGARVRLPFSIPVAGISADDELEVEEASVDRYGDGRYLVRAVRVPRSSPVAPGAGGGRGWVDAEHLQEVGEQLRLLNPQGTAGGVEWIIIRHDRGEDVREAVAGRRGPLVFRDAEKARREAYRREVLANRSAPGGLVVPEQAWRGGTIGFPFHFYVQAKDVRPVGSRAAVATRRRRKVRVLRTEATTTRQLARALRDAFGAVLPRRISVEAPAGRLKLFRRGTAWVVWRGGRKVPELGADLAADLKKLASTSRSPRCA